MVNAQPVKSVVTNGEGKEKESEKVSVKKVFKQWGQQITVCLVGKNLKSFTWITAYKGLACLQLRLLWVSIYRLSGSISEPCCRRCSGELTVRWWKYSAHPAPRAARRRHNEVPHACGEGQNCRSTQRQQGATASNVATGQHSGPKS